MANRSEHSVHSSNYNAHTAIWWPLRNKNILDCRLNRRFRVFVNENGSNFSLTWSGTS